MFLAWLRVVARTALSDCRRRRASFWGLLHRRWAEPNEPETSSSDEDRLQGALGAALGKLDAETRVLLEDKYLSGASVAEIAQKLGISPKAAESRLTRARAELRRELLAALSRHE